MDVCTTSNCTWEVYMAAGGHLRNTLVEAQWTPTACTRQAELCAAAVGSMERQAVADAAPAAVVAPDGTWQRPVASLSTAWSCLPPPPPPPSDQEETPYSAPVEDNVPVVLSTDWLREEGAEGTALMGVLRSAFARVTDAAALCACRDGMRRLHPTVAAHVLRVTNHSVHLAMHSPNLHKGVLRYCVDGSSAAPSQCSVSVLLALQVALRVAAGTLRDIAQSRRQGFEKAAELLMVPLDSPHLPWCAPALLGAADSTLAAALAAPAGSAGALWKEDVPHKHVWEVLQCALLTAAAQGPPVSPAGWAQELTLLRQVPREALRCSADERHLEPSTPAPSYMVPPVGTRSTLQCMAAQCVDVSTAVRPVWWWAVPEGALGGTVPDPCQGMVQGGALHCVPKHAAVPPSGAPGAHEDDVTRQHALSSWRVLPSTVEVQAVAREGRCTDVRRITAAACVQACVPHAVGGTMLQGHAWGGRGTSWESLQSLARCSMSVDAVLALHSAAAQHCLVDAVRAAVGAGVPLSQWRDTLQCLLFRAHSHACLAPPTAPALVQGGTRPSASAAALKCTSRLLQACGTAASTLLEEASAATRRTAANGVGAAGSLKDITYSMARQRAYCAAAECPSDPVMGRLLQVHSAASVNTLRTCAAAVFWFSTLHSSVQEAVQGPCVGAAHRAHSEGTQAEDALVRLQEFIGCVDPHAWRSAVRGMHPADMDASTGTHEHYGTKRVAVAAVSAAAVLELVCGMAPSTWESPAAAHDMLQCARIVQEWGTLAPLSVPHAESPKAHPLNAALASVAHAATALLQASRAHHCTVHEADSTLQPAAPVQWHAWLPLLRICDTAVRTLHGCGAIAAGGPRTSRVRNAVLACAGLVKSALKDARYAHGAGGCTLAAAAAALLLDTSGAAQWRDMSAPLQRSAAFPGDALGAVGRDMLRARVLVWAAQCVQDEPLVHSVAACVLASQQGAGKVTGEAPAPQRYGGGVDKVRAPVRPPPENMGCLRQYMCYRPSTEAISAAVHHLDAVGDTHNPLQQWLDSEVQGHSLLSPLPWLPLIAPVAPAAVLTQ